MIRGSQGGWVGSTSEPAGQEFSKNNNNFLIKNMVF